jgi:hypothetical protein
MLNDGLQRLLLLCDCWWCQNMGMYVLYNVYAYFTETFLQSVEEIPYVYANHSVHYRHRHRLLWQ